jgi:hypothetical protein
MLTISSYQLGKGRTYKRRLLCTCILWILYGAVSSHGSSAVTDDGMRWASDDVVGPVHSVHSKTADIHQVGNQWVESEPLYESIVTFDRANTFIEEVTLKPIMPVVPGLSPTRYRCLVRDRDKRILQSFYCDHDRRLIDSFRHVYLYDARGHLVEDRTDRITGEGPTGDRNIYEYDATGQKTAWRWYDSDGVLIQAVLFHPDREKHLVAVQVEAEAGGFQTKEIYAVDSMERPIEIVSFDDHGEILSKTRLSYDDHGKWVERILSARGGDVREVVLYEYDKRGNWIKRTTRTIQPTGEERSITRRRIEYYPD